MLDEEAKMEIIQNALAEGYEGNFTDLFIQQEQAMQQQQQGQNQQQPEESQQMQQPSQPMPAAMEGPQYEGTGDLVQSYQDAPPGIANNPVGENVSGVVSDASSYQTGGMYRVSDMIEYESGGEHKSAEVDDYVKKLRKNVKSMGWKQEGGVRQFKKGGPKSKKSIEDAVEDSTMLDWLNPLYLQKRVTNQIPLNIRAFGNSLIGNDSPMSEEDLNWREKKALEDARKRAEERGSNVIEYPDYGTHLDDEGNAYQSAYDDVGGGAGYQAVTKSLDPAYSIKTTFGQMNFKKKKDGTYEYSDEYDFNNATGGGIKGWWEGAKTKGLDLYGQARNVATNFGPSRKDSTKVKIKMKRGGYKSKYGW